MADLFTPSQSLRGGRGLALARRGKEAAARRGGVLALWLTGTFA